MEKTFNFMKPEIQDSVTTNGLKHSMSTLEESLSTANASSSGTWNDGPDQEAGKKSRWKWLFCKCSMDLLLKKKCEKIKLMKIVYAGDLIDGMNANVILEKICMQGDNKKSIDKNNNELSNEKGNYYLTSSNKKQKTFNQKLSKLVNRKTNFESARCSNVRLNFARCQSDTKLDNKVLMENYTDLHGSNASKYNFGNQFGENRNEPNNEDTNRKEFKNISSKNSEIHNIHQSYEKGSLTSNNCLDEQQNKKLYDRNERQKLVLLKDHQNFKCIELKAEDVLQTSFSTFEAIASSSSSISSQTSSSISSSSSPPSSSTPQPTFFSFSSTSSLQPSSSIPSSSTSLISLFLTSPSPLSTNTFSFLTFSASSPYSSSNSPSPIVVEDSDAKVSNLKHQEKGKKFHFNIDVANNLNGEKNEDGDNGYNGKEENSDNGFRNNKNNNKNDNICTNKTDNKNGNMNFQHVSHYDESIFTTHAGNTEDLTLNKNTETGTNTRSVKEKTFNENQGLKKLKKSVYNKSCERGNRQNNFKTKPDFQIVSFDQTYTCSFCSRLTTSSSLDWSTAETDESGDEDSNEAANRTDRYRRSTTPHSVTWQLSAGGNIKKNARSSKAERSHHNSCHDAANSNNVNKNNNEIIKNNNNDVCKKNEINDNNGIKNNQIITTKVKTAESGNNLEKDLITYSRSDPGELHCVQKNEKTDNTRLNDTNKMSFMKFSNDMANLSCMHAFEDKVTENVEDRKKKFQKNKNFFLSVENQKFQKNICFLNSYKLNRHRRADLNLSNSTSAVINAYSVMNNTLNISNNVKSDGIQNTLNKQPNNKTAEASIKSNTSSESKKDWKTMRAAGKQNELELILANVKNNKRQLISYDDSLLLTKKKVKRSIKKWFGSSTKLNKSFKKGLYLCSLVHQKGKILLTCEDMLPSVQVSCDQIPSIFNLKKHFNWLARVVCNWDGVRTLKRTLQKSTHLNDSFEFRSKILQALQNLKRAVNLEDLGVLHYEMLIDNEIGSQVFLLIKSIPEETKLATSLRWHSINKLMRKRLNAILSSQNESISLPTAPSDGLSFTDRLIATLPEKIHIAKTYKTKLPQGLYIGYVRVTSFIDQLKILVPQNPPNVFPYIKIRNNSKVTKKEWNALVNLNSREESTKSFKSNANVLNDHKQFALQVFKSCNELLKQLKIDKNEICRHRLYVKEMFEFNQEVAFILLLPSAKEVCSGLGDEQRNFPGCINLPLHHFEIYQMQTYHTELCQRYSHLSVLLEAESVVASQQMRETFSESHLKVGKEEKCIKEHVRWLQEQQKHLDETWRSMRWVAEVINNARDCRLECSVQLY